MSLPPHEFWQQVFPAGTHAASDEAGYADAYPANLPDGRTVLLPVRILPGDGRSAVASLIVNQASFEVEDALSQAMAEAVRPYRPDIVVGVPTLGLPLANAVARKLGHQRMVALGTSRKFWYDDALSEPLASITTPDHKKLLYLDPRMTPVLAGQRVLLVDDVVSSGSSSCAALQLLAKAGIAPVAFAVAMTQGGRWREPLSRQTPGLPVLAAITSPRLTLSADGRWRPES